MGHKVQNNQMSIADTLGLGFMTFAFFLGAGNLIFPPLAGFLAGENMTLAMFGFLVTAVGLPLITLIAVAKANGKIMSLLPPIAATALAVAIFIIIGPAFAAPRTGLVAFEVGFKPFLDNAEATFMIAGITLNVAQLLYTLMFFSISMVFALYPGKLLDNVGKVLTPILILLLVGLAASVIFLPGSPVAAAVGEYQTHPLTKGVLEGYNTMDTLASLIFGILIIDILRKKGITDPKAQTGYLIKAALIAAGGLAFVYIALFYLGATAGDLAAGAENGGVILTNYVTHEFGTTGLVLLSTVVTLACLTTAVGLISACSEFFNELLPKISYRRFVVILSVICATIANVGLAQLISISIPVLMTVYPVAIALVAVTFLTERFAKPEAAHRIVLSVALFFGIIDGIKAAGVDVSAFNFMPLHTEGMAWLLPTAMTIFACLMMKKEQAAVAVS
ncbi:branched-chain amino acid transport system II carrier protein [Shewanella sp. Choline-02u-19]|uniref:branched-chain amino acid transport system II carrier protein n=1 Tax=unclassified Shewanella TaxID=196818 RepID=UPI000C31CAFE|nr:MULTISPECIES: branched-chain amino acid transport system II carrier protein [unclassified Shewanella]PKG55336.1 branched-chain amino acid transport system II carrier protein [Shewanella sp. GutDb-MelDb]PKG76171.1 branched-chain amino acid transport system II carrier protein [Shewanella sp. GutCb]PKH56301.1 branched-chain amino acid transport system II carrier protein [Shewanella sp. Bg11-22]PKI30095.1 branched-chain amino acid transport system II carrier protein [Shewanella sp. Choline-02u-1